MSPHKIAELENRIDELEERLGVIGALLSKKIEKPVCPHCKGHGFISIPVSENYGPPNSTIRIVKKIPCPNGCQNTNESYIKPLFNEAGGE